MQATSRPPIEDTTTCSRIAHGSGFGSGMAFAAALSPRNTDSKGRGIRLLRANLKMATEKKTIAPVACVCVRSCLSRLIRTCRCGTIYLFRLHERVKLAAGKPGMALLGEI